VVIRDFSGPQKLLNELFDRPTAYKLRGYDNDTFFKGEFEVGDHKYLVIFELTILDPWGQAAWMIEFRDKDTVNYELTNRRHAYQVLSNVLDMTKRFIEHVEPLRIGFYATKGGPQNQFYQKLIPYLRDKIMDMGYRVTRDRGFKHIRYMLVRQNALNENRSVKKHTSYDGLDLSIEIPKGSYRRGTNHKGEEWSQKMACHYGYIKLTGAPDGDHLDCYLRPKPLKNASIYVVHQLTPDGSRYDEDKVMLGFGSRNEATKAWREHAYKPNKMMGAVSEWLPEHFRAVVHACRNSNVIMAREDTLTKLHRKGVDLGGCKLPNTVTKRLSESLGDTVQQAEQVMWARLRQAQQGDSFQGIDGGWISWTEAELGETGRLALERLQATGCVDVNTRTVSGVGVPLPQDNWPDEDAKTVYSVKLKDNDMSKNGKLYGNLHERKQLVNTIMEWREGLKNLRNSSGDYTSKLMENFRSELHKYSEYETEYRKAELEAMPTWQLAQHMSTLNESADLGSTRVELIEQILSSEGHKK
jgi:hypothetical protein